MIVEKRRSRDGRRNPFFRLRARKFRVSTRLPEVLWQNILGATRAAVVAGVISENCTFTPCVGACRIMFENN